MVGDFNMSKIAWVYILYYTILYSNDETGSLTCLLDNLCRQEAKFIEVCSANGLSQKNNFSNSQGKFLDVLFSSNSVNTSTYLPLGLELIDKNSIQHYATVLCTFLDENKEQQERQFNLHRIELKETLQEMSITHFDNSQREDFEGISYSEINILTDRIDGIISQFLGIQRNHTSTKITRTPSDISTHPWTNNKNYERLHKYKLNKSLLRLCNVNLHATKGIKCSGDARIINLRKNLQCFVISVDIEEFNEQISDIYRIHYVEASIDMWAYITPVAEYCSPIWSQNRIMIELRLERPLHYSTRSAVPFRQDAENYICFEERLKILGMLTFRKRRTIASIIFHLEILHEFGSEHSATLKACIHSPAYTSRSPNILVFDHV